jgi:hypothetical protein
VFKNNKKKPIEHDGQLLYLEYECMISLQIRVNRLGIINLVVKLQSPKMNNYPFSFDQNILLLSKLKKEVKTRGL